MLWLFNRKNDSQIFRILSQHRIWLWDANKESRQGDLSFNERQTFLLIFSIHSKIPQSVNSFGLLVVVAWNVKHVSCKCVCLKKCHGRVSHRSFSFTLPYKQTSLQDILNFIHLIKMKEIVLLQEKTSTKWLNMNAKNVIWDHKNVFWTQVSRHIF